MRSVAVVEDNPDNRMLLEAILEDRYRVSRYESGLEAVVGIRRTLPDLVLLDISLPGMDGPEVLKRLRTYPDTQRLPIVALTAHAMAGDRERFIEMGFDAYISKPILDEEDLFAVIDALSGSG